jgi:ABC-type methionine transport system permease subunit
MNTTTRKRISVVCLVFAILWFVMIGLFEAHYVRNVIRQKDTLHHILGTIYEEQIEGINFVVLVIYLVPGVFGLFMHLRFRREN